MAYQSTNPEKPELTDFLKQIEGVTNILIGNGFSLSHPTLGNCFRWDLKIAFNSMEDLIPEESSDCPESDYGKIRTNASKKILKYYLNKLGNAHNDEVLQNIWTQYRQRNHRLDPGFLQYLEKKPKLYLYTKL